MPLIDGVGDEVIEFLIAVLLVLVAALAWWSTNARPDRYASTVLVMRSRAHHTVTVCTNSRQNPAITRAPNQTSSSDSSGTSTSSRVPGSRAEAARAGARVHVPLQEMDSIVDADLAMMNNNRLHFYRRIDSPSSANVTTEPVSEMNESPEESEPASNAQIQEMDNIVRAMEAEVTTFCDILGNDRDTADTTTSTDAKEKKSDASERSAAPTGSEAEPAAGDASTSGAPAPDARRILIKLKYLNDTLKEVEGSLDELLKDFKWRHFSTELSSACRVRLIFNGRVLCDEAATLSALGLHHRAVVHCLVHPGRSGAQQQPAREEPPLEAPSELLPGAPQLERVWDLENILMTLVSVALTVVWFFRCEYSNLFTASASVALLGLTVLYSVAIFGLYLSDAFHFDRRPAPAQAQPPPPQAQQPVNN